MPAELTGWSTGQRWLHWGIALLVVSTFVLGLVMVALPLEQLTEKFFAYQYHKSLGLMVLGLMAWRVGLRLWRGRPADEAALPEWQKRAAAVGHFLLYALLILVPVLGYLSACSAPVEVPTTLFLYVLVPHVIGQNEALYNVLRPVHEVAAWSLVLMALGHAGMAVIHHRAGMPTLRRMWRGVV